MKRILLDTHAWVWSALDSSRLTAVARAAILDADAVHLSPISLYEVTQKARLGKWPEIAPHIDALAAESETLPAPLTRDVAARAGMLDWAHRDPFDRFIAASALELSCPLVSKDAAFDAFEGAPGWQGRIWA